MSSEEQLKQGDVAGTLASLQNDVRSNPADPKLRVFLFQLLCVQGDWQRALTQLNVVGDLDSQSFPMVHTYREILRFEAMRAKVFSGEIKPLVLGEPEQWMAMWFEALRLSGTGDFAAAAEARMQALEASEDQTDVSGKIDDHAFDWVGDADSRIGPFFEAMVNGGYYWVPVNRVSEIVIDAPEDLRDMIWSPVTFTWTNAGKAVGFMPSRYALGSEEISDVSLLSRQTEWLDKGSDSWHGQGQRVFMTDADEHAMLGVRHLVLDNEMIIDESEPLDTDAPSAE